LKRERQGDWFLLLHCISVVRKKSGKIREKRGMLREWISTVRNQWFGRK